MGELIKLTKICKSVSLVELPRSATTFRTYEAENLFHKVTLHAISLVKLFPNGEEKIQEWDPGAFANIARSIIEINKVFNYLCEYGISKEEFDFREFLSALHHENTIRKIYEKLEIKEICFEESFYKRACMLNIKNNTVYNNMSEKERIVILKAKKAYYYERVTKKYIVLSENIESGIYNMLSNSVHSYPYGLTNISIKSINDSSINLFSFSIEASILYLSNTVLNYMRLRKKLSKLVSKDDISFIQEMAKTIYLEQLIKEQKKKVKDNFFS